MKHLVRLVFVVFSLVVTSPTLTGARIALSTADCGGRMSPS